MMIAAALFLCSCSTHYYIELLVVITVTEQAAFAQLTKPMRVTIYHIPREFGISSYYP
jgi:hypothetical protein